MVCWSASMDGFVVAGIMNNANNCTKCTDVSTVNGIYAIISIMDKTHFRSANKSVCVV